MKKIILCCVLLAIFLECSAQNTYVTVSGEAFFDRTLGGYPNFVGCRPATELSWGSYQNPCPYYAFPVPPRSQMRWGESAGSGVSGLGFEAITNQTVLINTDFYIGALYHFNYPIYNASKGTTLNIQFTIRNSTNTGLIGKVIYEFPMVIDETVNEAPCPYPGVIECSDKISFTNAFNPNSTFTLGDVRYTIRLQGFKESASSSSSPVNFFISDEETVNSAYLFARIEAACPSSCVNGGIYYILNNGNCACNCTNSPCPAGQVNTANCNCTCPDLNVCNHGNGGILLPNNNCSCQCNNCTSPKVFNPAKNDCSCMCPTNYCAPGSINNTDTCTCNCPTTCTRENEIRDARCNCYCPLNTTCVYPRVEDPNPNVCKCICDPNMVCPNSGETVDPNTCNCVCTKTCPNGQILNTANCSCGPCVGNWQQDVNGLCTVCPLTTNYCATVNMTLNSQNCLCVCDTLFCDIDIGKVVDTTQNCSCRDCRAGECKCGNGITEPGEDCDAGLVNDPCCSSQCKFTFASCDDNNACTNNDACQNGVCLGNYLCGVPTQCANVTCDKVLGCQTTPYENGLPCGNTVDLCHFQCIGGICSSVTINCGQDLNETDCTAPGCIASTGECGELPISGNDCSDNNGCTINDKCVVGVCTGAPLQCDQTGLQCATNTCKIDTGKCGLDNLPDLTPCDADFNNCTKGDYCLGGSCSIGNLTVCPPPANDTCKLAYCDMSTGNCLTQAVPNALNKTCNDQNYCTTNDTCFDGNCQGVQDPTLSGTAECGSPLAPGTATQTAAIAFSVAGAVAAIGAIVGMAFLIKKIRNSRIDDPDTWSPDTFHTVGSNPLYKGNESVVDNRMYEARA